MLAYYFTYNLLQLKSLLRVTFSVTDWCFIVSDEFTAHNFYVPRYYIKRRMRKEKYCIKYYEKNITLLLKYF